MKGNLVREYYDKIVNYGGVPTRRIDVIRDLEKRGGTPKMIEMYLIGMDQCAELKRRRNNEQTVMLHH